MRALIPPYLAVAALLLGLAVDVTAARAEPSVGPDVPSPTTLGALSGRWVLLQVTTTRSDLPFVGEARASTRAVLLYDLVQDGAQVAGSGELCSLDIEARPTLLRPVLPERFGRAVAPSPIEATLVEEGGVTRLRGVKTLVVLGADLKRPWDDALPENADDPRVKDTDGDGHPGVTIEIAGLVDAEVYMAQRRWDRLVGEVESRDRVAGTVFHGNEQSFLGSDLPLVNMIPQMDPDPERSRFLMQRVPGDATCQDALGLGRAHLPRMIGP